jgi:PIN domain nuclease of toxin-antitoxin system
VAAVTHLDTHVVVWLYAGEVDRFPGAARSALDGDLLAISPAVVLELQYLHEIGRLAVPAVEVVADLRTRLGLADAEAEFGTVVSRALPLAWTRDPFDRLIAAHAVADDARLLTADRALLANVPHAFWD